MKWEEWDKLKSRLKASCSKRGRSKPWQERESRLRELFSRIDSMGTGYIAQEDLDIFAQSLRMPRAFVHDFVDEGDQSGEGKMSFEEFAAFVRSKEISLQASFDSLQPDSKGRIKGARLKKNLKNLEIRAGRYNTRKKIRAKGVERMLKYVDDDATLTAADFRDMMILIPNGQLQTVSPYYMKVGLDIGPAAAPHSRQTKRRVAVGAPLRRGARRDRVKTVSSPLNVVAVRSIASSDGTGLPRTRPRDLQAHEAHLANGGHRRLVQGEHREQREQRPGQGHRLLRVRRVFTLDREQRQGTYEPRAAPRRVPRRDDLRHPPVPSRWSARASPWTAASTAASPRRLRKIAKKEGLRGLYAGWRR